MKKAGRFLARSFLFGVCLFLIQAPTMGYADQVQMVYPDGTLELENGRRVRFAGLDIPRESHKILRILLANQELKILIEKSEPKAVIGGSDAEPVYIFMKTQEMVFGSEKIQQSVENKMMVNEFLLKIGAARVSTQVAQRKMKEFKTLEAEAKQSGVGIWSFNTPLES